LNAPSVIQDDIESINILSEHGRIRSALKLMYCVLDHMGALAFGEGKASHRSFCKFVEQFVLPCARLPFHISSETIYRARSAFLHTGRWLEETAKSHVDINLKWHADRSCAHQTLETVAFCSDCEDCYSTQTIDFDEFWRASRAGIQSFFESCHDAEKVNELLRGQAAISWTKGPPEKVCSAGTAHPA